MSNFMNWHWVKVVNKLFMQHRISRGYVSTPLTRLRTFTGIRVGTGRLFPGLFRPFSFELSTQQTPNSYLSTSLFTHYPQGLLLQPLRKNLKG